MIAHQNQVMIDNQRELVALRNKTDDTRLEFQSDIANLRGGFQHMQQRIEDMEAECKEIKNSQQGTGSVSGVENDDVLRAKLSMFIQKTRKKDIVRRAKLILPTSVRIHENDAKRVLYNSLMLYARKLEDANVI